MFWVQVHQESAWTWLWEECCHEDKIQHVTVFCSLWLHCRNKPEFIKSCLCLQCSWINAKSCWYCGQPCHSFPPVATSDKRGSTVVGEILLSQTVSISLQITAQCLPLVAEPVNAPYSSHWARCKNMFLFLFLFYSWGGSVWVCHVGFTKHLYHLETVVNELC